MHPLKVGMWALRGVQAVAKLAGKARKIEQKAEAAAEAVSAPAVAPTPAVGSQGPLAGLERSSLTIRALLAILGVVVMVLVLLAIIGIVCIVGVKAGAWTGDQFLNWIGSTLQLIVSAL